MISGRYRTEMMCRFWSSNKRGYCLAPTCHEVEGDLQHLLVVCPSLEHNRHQLHGLWCRKTKLLEPLHHLIIQKLGSSPAELTGFILDCMSCSQLMDLVQLYGQTVLDIVLYLTRTWAYSIHRQKQILLGRWPGQNGHGHVIEEKIAKQPISDTYITRTNFDVVGSVADYPSEVSLLPDVQAVQHSGRDQPPVATNFGADCTGVGLQHAVQMSASLPAATISSSVTWQYPAIYSQYIYSYGQPPIEVAMREDQHVFVPVDHDIVGCGVPGLGGAPCCDGGAGGGGCWHQPASPSIHQQTSQLRAASPGHRGRCCGPVSSITTSYHHQSCSYPCSVDEGTE